MNLQELTQRLRAEHGREGGGWEDRYHWYLNRAQLEIASFKDWPWLYASNTMVTVAGTEEYTLATDVKRLRAMHVTDTSYARRLVPVGFDDLMSTFGPINTALDRGTPDYFYPTGRTGTASALKIKFYPVPDAVYNLTYDYVKRPTEMTADTSVPDVPEPYHPLMADYALWKSFLQERDYQTAREHERLYREGLRRMAGEYNQQESTETEYITYGGEETY